LRTIDPNVTGSPVKFTNNKHAGKNLQTPPHLVASW
jgi:hypothetical protein